MNSSAGRAFRPCPFPVYDDNPVRRRIVAALRGVLLVAALSVLVPIQSGPGASGGTAVFWQRVTLDSRAPAAILLDFNAADFGISPPSLGFFEQPDRFIYTGDATRGLIYGERDGEVLLVEIDAAGDSEIYMEDYLDRIREKVALSNNIKNDLLITRRAQPDQRKTDSAFELAWEEIRPELTGAADFLWPDRVLSSYPALQTKIEARLGAEARHIALLKELYYQSQEARLGLLVAQHDLQLALIHSPHQAVPMMDNLTDREVAREAMLGELERISGTWTMRRDELTRDLATDGYWLKTVEDGQAGIQQRSSAVLRERIQGSPLSTTRSEPSAELSPRQRLEISLVQARIVVANAELQKLDSALGSLEQLLRHVRAGVAQPGALPEKTVLRSVMVPASTVQRQHEDWIDGLVAAADNPLQVVGFFAARFNEPGLELNLPDREQFRRETYPEELPLCLAAAELLLRMDRVGSIEVAVETAEENDLSYAPGIIGQLEQVSLFPEDYTPLSHHLSFLQFLNWYLDRV